MESKLLFKEVTLKPYFEEKALVVRKTPSGILCELPNRKTFSVPTKFPLSFFYENKTVVGLKSSSDILESKEVPVDISIDKIRFEAEWDQVLAQYEKRHTEQSEIPYWISVGANKCTCAGSLTLKNL